MYVDDVVNAMIAASTAPDVNQLTINVGSGRETSVRELAQMVVAVTGANPEIVYNPRSDRGSSRLCADLTLAGDKLNFKPASGWNRPAVDARAHQRLRVRSNGN